MRVEFIELLRCPAPHASSPLITVANKRHGDEILDAALGCVMCGAEYALRDGCAVFPARDGQPDCQVSLEVVISTAAGDPLPSAADRSDEALRLAALLGLADATARAMLCGDTTLVSHDIEALTGVRCLAVNAPATLTENRPIDRLTMALSDRIPLGDSSLHGLAVDLAHVGLLSDATRVVRRGGRIVAPASASLPLGCRELARDARQWVVEVDATTSAPVTLQRATSIRTETHPG